MPVLVSKTLVQKCFIPQDITDFTRTILLIREFSVVIRLEMIVVLVLVCKAQSYFSSRLVDKKTY